MYRKKPRALERRLSKEGEVAVRRVDPAAPEEVAKTVDWMLECKRGWSDRTGKSGDWLHSVHFRNFLIAMICPKDGDALARLIVVTLDGAPGAALILCL